MEENKYENIISKYTDKQLICERAILLKKQDTLRAQLKMLDDECKRRLEIKNERKCD